MSSSNKPRAFNPPDVPKPPPSYDQVCITPILPTSKLITLAGQTGRQTDGSIASDIKSQAKAAYETVNRCLKAAGASPRDIVHVRHYIVKDTGIAGEEDVDVVHRGWADLWIEFMDKEADGHKPPDTVVGVACLAVKGLLYEVEVTAIVSS